MNRRRFLQSGSISGLGMVLLPGQAWVEPGKVPDLVEATIQQLQEQMKNGLTTSVQITQEYLKRIKAIDRQGPTINSVIEVNPDAVEIAESLDKERKNGKVRGPMHGIPVLVKDNLNTADRMMTTAGSLALEGNFAKTDSFVVRQLRLAGAVILGKTNLSEWANFRSNRSTSGWSSRGGQTKCPYMLDHNPSGSSAGSGAATAASLCTVSIGTETDGSIVSPASVNGLVGIKPTVGLVSRSGIIPISATQDTAGPMARTVRDAVILLGAITGIDQDDKATLESKGRSHTDYTEYLDNNGLRGKRIGIEKRHLTTHPPCVKLFREAISVLKAQGATIVEVELLKALDQVGDHSEFTVLLYEFKDGVNKYLADNNTRMKSLAEVIAFDSANASRVMPWFEQEDLIESNLKGDLNDQLYKEALSKTLNSRKIITELMKAQNLDAVCGITAGLSFPIDLVNGDNGSGPSMSTPAAISGFPHITVPMGQVHDLPVGISFFASAYQEPKLISIAYAYEQASKLRQAPRYLPSLPVQG